MPYSNCEIDGGRTVGCKESLGGVKAVYIGNFVDIPAGTGFVDTADVVSVIAAQTFYKFEQVLSCTFQLLDSTDVADIRNLCQARPNIWVEDNNLNVFLIGAEYGCNVTGGNIQTGAAFSDMSGYTIDFTAREQNPIYFAAGVTAAAPLGGVSGATVG